ncbi:hypothetical protein RUND412_010770 [Rhizina undulata]
MVRSKRSQHLKAIRGIRIQRMEERRKARAENPTAFASFKNPPDETADPQNPKPTDRLSDERKEGPGTVGDPPSAAEEEGDADEGMDRKEETDEDAFSGIIQSERRPRDPAVFDKTQLTYRRGPRASERIRRREVEREKELREAAEGGPLNTSGLLVQNGDGVSTD